MKPTKILLHFLEDVDYSQKYIDEKRKIIYNIISEQMDYKINRIDCYRDSDIYSIISLYDKHFFESKI